MNRESLVVIQLCNLPYVISKIALFEERKSIPWRRLRETRFFAREGGCFGFFAGVVLSRRSERERERGVRCTERVRSTRTRGTSSYCSLRQSPVSRTVPLLVAASRRASWDLVTSTQPVCVQSQFSFSLFLSFSISLNSCITFIPSFGCLYIFNLSK